MRERSAAICFDIDSSSAGLGGTAAAIELPGASAAIGGGGGAAAARPGVRAGVRPGVRAGVAALASIRLRTDSRRARTARGTSTAAGVDAAGVGAGSTALGVAAFGVTTFGVTATIVGVPDAFGLGAGGVTARAATLCRVVRRGFTGVGFVGMSVGTTTADPGGRDKFLSPPQEDSCTGRATPLG